MTPKDSAKLPLELVARYTKEYPGVWDAAQEMREIPKDAWDKQRCYLPIAAKIAAMTPEEYKAYREKINKKARENYNKRKLQGGG